MIGTQKPVLTMRMSDFEDTSRSRSPSPAFKDNGVYTAWVQEPGSAFRMMRSFAPGDAGYDQDVYNEYKRHNQMSFTDRFFAAYNNERNSMDWEDDRREREASMANVSARVPSPSPQRGARFDSPPLMNRTRERVTVPHFYPAEECEPAVQAEAPRPVTEAEALAAAAKKVWRVIAAPFVWFFS